MNNFERRFGNEWCVSANCFRSIFATIILLACAACSDLGNSDSKITATDQSSEPGDESDLLSTEKHRQYHSLRPAGFNRLVFKDEFKGRRLNRRKWCTRLHWAGPRDSFDIDEQCRRKGPPPRDYYHGVLDTLNDEEQLYVDTNQQGQPMHSVSNGTLKLHASLMTDPVADTVIEQRVFKYESAMLRSKRLFRPNKKRSYYITARVRLPNVRGTLPQFWLAPSIGRDDFVSQWPPEIDIMEAPINGRGAETEYTIWQSTVLGQEGGVLPGPQTDSGLHEFTYKLNAFQPDASVQDEYCCWQTTAESLRETWIEVGTEWTTDEVCFYLNGVKFSCENYKWRHQIDSEKSVLANKAHLLMNFAIGGAWAGRHGVDDQAFPTAMEVDYIRVYKRNESKRSKRGYRQR